VFLKLSLLNFGAFFHSSVSKEYFGWLMSTPFDAVPSGGGEPGPFIMVLRHKNHTAIAKETVDGRYVVHGILNIV
jgi:hypothetical protein